MRTCAGCAALTTRRASASLAFVSERFDVVIVGAGLSGIGAACHLRRNCPDRTFAILESRDAIGGTWDLFRYPGIRSDSDMFTFGYSFEPWTEPKALADGPSIRAYVQATARKYDVERHIRFGHRMVRAAWSSADAEWTIEVTRRDGSSARFRAGFLWLCTGYYRYDAGHTPEFRGRERFRGRIVHPQHWPEDLDYTGQRVVVIGSGATAVTLVPAMAERAAHVTMLQRSPTYIISMPAIDKVAARLQRLLPGPLAYRLARWKNIALSTSLYQMSRRQPARVRRWILGQIRRQLGPDFDVKTHFTPRYDPWDQRLCLVPDADLFAAIREGKASVVTDTIETFTETGIRLTSGRELPADLIVTATGLELLFLGGAEVLVDGRPIDLPSRMTYRGLMLDGVPNLAFTIGYINASWTLRADLVAEHVCRLLNHMAKIRARQVTPRRPSDVGTAPILSLTSGYIQRAIDRVPRQGTRDPWRVRQNYILELLRFRLGRVADPALEFT